MSYEIEGRLLEVCTCNVLCPCWVGEDPDGGTCDSTIAWRVETGSIEGVDVAGLTLAASVHIPGNVLDPKSWTAVDLRRRARDATSSRARCSRLFTGQLGGAVADLAGLIGEVVSVERAPITFTVDGGKGRIAIGERRRRRPDAVPSARPASRRRSPDRLLDDPRLAGLRHQVEPRHTRRRASTASRASTSTGNNALQGHFRFAD